MNGSPVRDIQRAPLHGIQCPPTKCQHSARALRFGVGVPGKAGSTGGQQENGFGHTEGQQIQ